MKFGATNADSDSGNSPSDLDEKRIGVAHGEFETAGRGHLPPDPDADLSEAERAHIVSILIRPSGPGRLLIISCRE